MASEKKVLFKNFASLGVVQFANYFLPLISVPVISRIIGPDKYGAINYAAAFVTYFNLLISYGFDLTATRRLAKDPTDTELRIKVFNEVFSAQLLLFVISAIIFLACLFTIPNLSVEKAVSSFSFLICVATLLTQNWLFQAMRDLPKMAVLNLISKLLFTVLVLMLIKKKEDYILQPLIYGLLQVGVAIGSFIWAYRLYKLKLSLIPVNQIIKLLWTEKTVFFSLVVISFYTTTNTVMLGFMEDQKQVGYYTAAQRLISIASTVINMPLAQSLYPYIGKALAENKENGLQTVRKLLPLMVLGLGGMGLIMFFLGPIVLRLFYGPAFSPSIPAFQIIAFVPLIVAISNVLGIQIMLNLRMDRPFFYITSAGAAIGLVLNYFMIKFFGYLGPALNWLIVEIYITATMLIFLQIRGIKPVDLKQFSLIHIFAQIQPFTSRLFKK